MHLWTRRKQVQLSTLQRISIGSSIQMFNHIVNWETTMYVCLIVSIMCFQAILYMCSAYHYRVKIPWILTKVPQLVLLLLIQLCYHTMQLTPKRMLKKINMTTMFLPPQSLYLELNRYDSPCVVTCLPFTFYSVTMFTFCEYLMETWIWLRYPNDYV